MKHALKKAVLVFCLFLTGGLNLHAQAGWWTWMKGDTVMNVPGNYGTLGIFAPGNNPPSLFGECGWTDLNGNFWLFGGGQQGINQRSDIWEFKPALNQWAWMKGPGITNQQGNYGTKGVPALTNIPGASSYEPATWTDKNGDLWFFGGNGIDINGNIGLLADMWRYQIASNTWTWMNGPGVVYQTGQYGTQGIPAPGNYPPAREAGGAAWTDNTGNLWLFGGWGNNATGQVFFNDLWKYSITSNTWTWIRGSNQPSSIGSFGTQGIASASNDPAARATTMNWKDTNGDLWIFGGDVTGSNVGADLWKYAIASNMWTWMKGPNTWDYGGSYGPLCTACSTNEPAARRAKGACWSDRDGNFWMFSGDGPAAGTMNDLWFYNPLTNKWTLSLGSMWSGPYQHWGTRNVPAPANYPSNTYYTVSFHDLSGNLWMFGDFSNELWRYMPDTACVYGSSCAEPLTSSFALSPAAGCAPFLTAFSNLSTGAISYSWNFGDAQTSTLTSPSHIYPNTGTYTVVLITSNGTTSDTSSQLITVYAKPIASITGTDSICKGQSGTWTGHGGGMYTWNTGDTSATVSYHPVSNTVYTLTVSNGHCSSTDSVKVIVTPLPTLLAFPDTTLATGTSCTLHATGSGSSYTWSPATGLSCTNCPTPTADPAQTTTYTVTSVNTQGCAVTTTVTITVECMGGEIFVPNLFTPNGDQQNDVACVYGGCIQSMHFAVYDRWGEKVFETRDQGTCWDGTYQGHLMNSAVFVYYLQVVLVNGKEINLKGNISLMR